MEKTRILGNCSRGLLFVLSAPAGTGKTTLARMLAREFFCIKESISLTTRPPRLGEEEGVDYYFLTKETFEEKIRGGAFLEYAKVYGHYYGTSKEFVEMELSKGHHVILVIDTQGALQLKGKIPAVFVFMSPPSLEELKERLLRRKTENLEKIEERLAWAKKEIELASHYDYYVVNDHLETAYQVLRSIIIAEEHKVYREGNHS